MSKSIDQYTLGRKLGAGATAKVYEAMDDQGQEFAVKVFDHSNPRVTQQIFQYLQDETKAALHLNHTNVVRYFAYKQDSEMIRPGKNNKSVSYVVMERIRGGELFDFIAYGGAFSERECRYFFKQALSGLHHIQIRGFAHRDLKPENIMMSDQNELKIVDFGFAIESQGRGGQGITHSYKGTPGYMAPEIIANQPYQPNAVDLFALGTILFIMRAASIPFKQAKSQDRHYRKVINSEIEAFWRDHQASHADDPEYFSEGFKDLVTNMLRYQPSSRICMADIIGHPWVASEDCATPEEIAQEFATRK